MARKQKLPPGISKRTDGGGRVRYRVRIFGWGKQWQVGDYDTLTDAKTALAIEKGLKANGQWTPPSQRRNEERQRHAQQAASALTVAQWAEKWLDQQEELAHAGRLSYGTVTTRRSLVRRNITPTIGHYRLVDLTPEIIQRLIDDLDKIPAKRVKGARGNGTTANVITCLKTMFAAAVEANAGGLTVSPVKAKHRPSQRIKPVTDGSDFATPAEIVALASAMPDHLQLAVLLGAWCDMRLGEVLGLKRKDFLNLAEPARAQVVIERQWNSKTHPPMFTPPKSGSHRRVSIPANIVPDIVHHLQRFTGADPESVIFPGMKPGHPVSHTAFNRAFKVVRDRIKPGFRFHDGRATGLTQYARSGATLRDVMARGGHRNAEVALRYQRMADERDREVTARMNEGVISLSTYKQQVTSLETRSRRDRA